MLHLIRRDVRQVQQDRSRWTLDLIGSMCPWLKLGCAGSLSAWLKRHGIRYKRARAYVHSPDSAYLAKLRTVRVCVEAVQVDPTRQVLLFADEFGYTRQPSLSQAYAAVGSSQERAAQGHTANKVWRVVGAVDAWSGRLHSLQQGHITVPALVRFYEQLVAAYPKAERLYLVVDNWPVHFHPDVRAALMPQWLPFPIHPPKTWPLTASARAKRLGLPIQLVQLPTYASWCNPIEKVWRKLRQELLHVHRYEDDWAGLRQAVERWLGKFTNGSPSLLRYIGLSDLGKLYRAAFDHLAQISPLPS